MAHGGQAGLLLLLDLLVLAERTPQRAKDHDHHDGHQQLIHGEAVLSGAFVHRDRLGCLIEAGVRRRCHHPLPWLPTGQKLQRHDATHPDR